MQPKPNVDPDLQRYAQFGRASLIPGIQKSIEFLQEMLDDIRTRLTAAEAVHATNGTVRQYRKKLGRPRKQALAEGRVEAKGGWPDTPEERSAEMRRRQAKWSKKAKKKLLAAQKTPNHPRNPEHPNHKAWLAAIARTKTAKKRERARAEVAAA